MSLYGMDPTALDALNLDAATMPTSKIRPSTRNRIGARQPQVTESPLNLRLPASRGASLSPGMPAEVPQTMPYVVDNNGDYQAVPIQQPHPALLAIAQGIQQGLSSLPPVSPYASGGDQFANSFLRTLAGGFAGNQLRTAKSVDDANQYQMERAAERNKLDAQASQAMKMKQMEQDFDLKKLNIENGTTPADPALLAGLASAKTITPAQAAYFKANGWTKKQRDELLTKSVPGASAMVAVNGMDPLSQQAIDNDARLYNATGQIGNYGRQGTAQMIAVRNRAAELANQGGGVDLAGNRADYKANTSSLNKLQSNLDATSAFITTADKNTKILEKAAAKISQTGIPLANQPLRSIDRSVLGSNDQAAYDVAIRTVQNEYAKILGSPNMNGELSDAARREVEGAMSKNATLGQLVSALHVLRADSQNRKTSYQSQIGEIRARIRGGGAASDTSDVVEWTRDPKTGLPVRKQP